jgi:hypothetical protein
VRRLHDRPEHPQLLPDPCRAALPDKQDGPGTHRPGGRSASHFQSPAPQMPAIIQWWRGGTPRETSSHPGGPPAGAPAPACSIAAVTLSDHQPEPRGDPRPGRRAGSLQPLDPAWHSHARGTLTWIAVYLLDSDMDWHSLATWPASSALPRPPLAAPDSDGTHHVTLSGTPSSPRDHGADSRKSATVRPARGRAGTPSVLVRPPGRPGRYPSTSPGRAPRDPSPLRPGPRQAPRGPHPVHFNPGSTDPSYARLRWKVSTVEIGT